ncbi:putative Late nodulin [Medicago truncatula]|uniref:Putative Late nodulin n=1 Tax=Medicago truncatula TaxID=3880 RepID=A0A396I631_MEDTR|nr:putative Late nodulin [Medicago truncatula]
MAEIIKFVYILILCVSLLLIGEASGKECVTDADCENLYYGNKWPLICSNIGYCLSSYEASSQVVLRCLSRRVKWRIIL